MSEEYRGYTNYETFIVSYYLKKEHYIYQHIMKYVEECKGDKYKLFGFIREFVLEQQPLTNASMYSAILWHSLGKVDYIEVAEDFLDV